MCLYKKKCSEFLKSLDLHASYLLPEHDRCYCKICVKEVRMPDVLEHDWTHGCKYEVPKGWCGFGLSTKPTAAAKDVFHQWAVSFHGCPKDVIASVLDQGELLMPGDKMIDGTELPNRLTVGDHRIGFYTSPSIRYSELDIYTKPAQWKGHTVRTVLQCRQKMDLDPLELRVEGETIGWARRFGNAAFSQHFPNSKIERFTKARGSIIPYRVPVGLDITTREQEEEDKKKKRAEEERKRKEEEERKRREAEERKRREAEEERKRREAEEKRKRRDAGFVMASVLQRRLFHPATVRALQNQRQADAANGKVSAALGALRLAEAAAAKAREDTARAVVEKGEAAVAADAAFAVIAQTKWAQVCEGAEVQRKRNREEEQKFGLTQSASLQRLRAEIRLYRS